MASAVEDTATNGAGITAATVAAGSTTTTAAATTPVATAVVPGGAAPAAGAGEYLTPNLAYPNLKKVHDNPPIYTVDEFLSIEECDKLIEAGAKHLSRSVVVGGKDGTDKPRVSAKTRTSQSYFFPKDQLPWLNEKVKALTGKPIAHFEPPQIAHYQKDQLYAPHFDAFDKATKPGRDCIATGGQRVATVLIYLNQVASGGGTYFPVLKQRFLPQKGRAIVFFPCTLDGELDKLCLHTGEKAVDPKWVSQIWIRQHNFGKPSPVAAAAAPAASS